MNKWFENNMFLRFVALLLGVLIWLSVGDHTVPSIFNDYDYLKISDVKVDTRLDDEKLKLLDISHKNVNLVLSGQKQTLEKVVPNYQVYVDLKKLTPGKYQYASIQVEGLPEGITYKANPQKIWVLVDRIVEKEFPVEMEWSGKYKEHLTYVKPEVNPSTIVVKGAETHVSKVNKVKGYFRLDEWDVLDKQKVQLQAVGKKGEVKNISLSKGSATVSMTEKWMEREVDLRPLVKKLPPPEVIIEEIKVKPEKLTLFGKRSQLNPIYEWVIPLDFSNLTADKTFQQELSLPEHVTFFPKRKIEIQVKIRKQS